MKNLIANQTYYKRKIGKRIVSHRLEQRIVKSTVDYIFSLIKPKIKKELKDLVVLDIGSGYGEYSIEMAKRVKMVVGVEPYLAAFNGSQKRKSENKINNVVFYNTVIENFKSGIKFDLAISLTTIEHMPYQEKSFKRVFELLKKGGYLYLTGPNRLWPYESHYLLPFLSWLPLPLANLYLKLTGKGQSYEDSAYSRTYWGMKRLFDNFSTSYELILPPQGAYFIGLGDSRKLYNIIKNIGIYLIGKFPLFWIFSKGFIFLVRNETKLTATGNSNPF